jgi:hypothetical protein
MSELNKKRDEFASESAKAKFLGSQLQLTHIVGAREGFDYANSLILLEFKKLEQVIEESGRIDSVEWRKENAEHMALALHAVSNSLLRAANEFKSFLNSGEDSKNRRKV